jgi:large subunit ribosomal protein L4e
VNVPDILALVLSDSVETIEKTSAALKLLKRIGVYELSGMLGPAITSALVKEKMKNKRYVSAWGPLMMV